MGLAAVSILRGAVAPVLLLGGWLLAQPLLAPVWAGEARILDASPDRVVIEASDAGVDEVLAALAQHFQFEVERKAATGQPVHVSGRLEGPLDAVLERLLRNEPHMIVRSAEARGGISRVVLFEGKGGVVSPSPVAGPIAAIKAKLRERTEIGKQRN